MPGYRFLRTRLEALDFAELTRRVEGWLADRDGRARHVACLNTYCVTLAQDDPALQAVYDGTDVSLGRYWSIGTWYGIRIELKAGASLDLHAADQLVPYLVLGGGGAFTVRNITTPLETVMWLMTEMTGARFTIEKRYGLMRVAVG